MLNRFKAIIHGVGELLSAEAEIAVTRARRAGMWGGVVLASTALSLIAALGLLVAGTAAMATRTGWIVALAAVSLMLLIAGVGAVVAGSRKLVVSLERGELPVGMSERSSHARLEICGGEVKSGVRALPHGSGPTSGNDGRTPFDPMEAVAECIAKSPALTLGGIVAVAALLGPSKSFKLAGRGLLLASIASRISEHFADNASGSTTRRHRGHSLAVANGSPVRNAR